MGQNGTGAAAQLCGVEDRWLICVHHLGIGTTTTSYAPERPSAVKSTVPASARGAPEPRASRGRLAIFARPDLHVDPRIVTVIWSPTAKQAPDQQVCVSHM